MSRPMTPSTTDPFANARSGHVDPHSLYRGPADAPVPSPQELGSRFQEMRTSAGISRAEAARRSGWSARSLERFEKQGRASAALLLDLIRAMSSSSSFTDAFRAPKFKSIKEVVRHGRQTR